MKGRANDHIGLSVQVKWSVIFPKPFLAADSCQQYFFWSNSLYVFYTRKKCQTYKLGIDKCLKFGIFSHAIKTFKNLVTEILSCPPLVSVHLLVTHYRDRGFLLQCCDIRKKEVSWAILSLPSQTVLGEIPSLSNNTDEGEHESKALILVYILKQNNSTQNYHMCFEKQCSGLTFGM